MACLYKIATSHINQNIMCWDCVLVKKKAVDDCTLNCFHFSVLWLIFYYYLFFLLCAVFCFLPYQKASFCQIKLLIKSR